MSRYNHLFEEVSKCKPSTILEIGTWNGTHAVQLINEAAKYTPKDDIIYYGFDLWDDLSEEQYFSEFLYPKAKASFDEANEKLRKTGIEYHLHRGNTRESLPVFNPSHSMDFVFIDGGHSIETIRSDWKNILRLIHQDSIVLFDDYIKYDKEFGCYLVIDDILETERFDVEILPTQDLNASGQVNQIVKVKYIYEQI